MALRVVLALVLTLMGCGTQEPDEGPECGPNGECPAGFTCMQSTRRCIRGSGSADAGDLGCPEPGAPVAHSGNITTNQTWGAGLHDVTFDVGIRQNATLTLEPCAVVRV